MLFFHHPLPHKKMPARIIRWYTDDGREKFKVLPHTQSPAQKKRVSSQGEPPSLTPDQLAKIQADLKRYDPHGCDE